MLTASAREAEEEIGVLIAPVALHHVHTLHVYGSEPRLGLFFETRRWVGEPVDRELAKCHALAWLPLDDLPTGIITYPAAGFDA